MLRDLLLQLVCLFRGDHTWRAKIVATEGEYVPRVKDLVCEHCGVTRPL